MTPLISSDLSISDFEDSLTALTANKQVVLDTNMFKSQVLSPECVSLVAKHKKFKGGLNAFAFYDWLRGDCAADEIGTEKIVDIVLNSMFDSRQYLSALERVLHRPETVVPGQVVKELSHLVGGWDIQANERYIEGLKPRFGCTNRNKFYKFNERAPAHSAIVVAKTDYLKELSSIIQNLPRGKVVTKCAFEVDGDDPDGIIVSQALYGAKTPLLIITQDKALRARIARGEFGEGISTLHEYGVVVSPSVILSRAFDTEQVVYQIPNPSIAA